MNNNYIDKDSEIYKAKECLYHLYNELLEEIKGSNTSIDQEEYDDKIQCIKIPNMIQYIKESIQILLDKKIEEYKEQGNGYFNHIDNENENSNNTNYEQLLQQAEGLLRRKQREIFKYRYKIDSLESQINSYIEMEDDYEDMKSKYKYENGKFLNNDRKDNEILILRSENSTLKAVINNQSNKDNETIKLLEAKIEQLTDKISQLEHDNSHKLIIKYKNKYRSDNDNYNCSSKACLSSRKEDSDMNEPPISERSHLDVKLKKYHEKRIKVGEERTAIEDKGMSNIYKRILNNLGNSNSTLKKKRHLRNYSLYMPKQNKKVNANMKSVPKYLGGNYGSMSNLRNSNNNSNNNYIKVNNIMPLSNKALSSKTQGQSIMYSHKVLSHTHSKGFL